MQLRKDKYLTPEYLDELASLILHYFNGYEVDIFSYQDSIDYEICKEFRDILRMKNPACEVKLYSDMTNKEIKKLIPEEGTVLVAGLGNEKITPDALGPLTLEHLIVSRHLIDAMPSEFGSLRPVCALSPGVLGTTGIETAELLRGAVARVQPSAVVAVDAMASRSLERLCRTFQLSDTGIAPGSGACNPRQELNRQTLGIPVIALGVPTVVEARTLALDLVPHGQLDEKSTPDAGMLVSPKDIDLQVDKCAKTLGYALNLALQGQMTAAEIEQDLC